MVRDMAGGSAVTFHDTACRVVYECVAPRPAPYIRENAFHRAKDHTMLTVNAVEMIRVYGEGQHRGSWNFESTG